LYVLQSSEFSTPRAAAHTFGSLGPTQHKKEGMVLSTDKRMAGIAYKKIAQPEKTSKQRNDVL
jgi:hypothetical protein